MLSHEGWRGTQKSRRSKIIPGKEMTPRKEETGRWECHEGKFRGKTIWLEPGACVDDE